MVCLAAISCCNWIVVIIGKWSVDGGRRAGSTSQLLIKLVSLLVMNMLSGLEYFLVTMCLRVGMPFAKIMLSLYMVISLMRFVAQARACCVKR